MLRGMKIKDMAIMPNNECLKKINQEILYSYLLLNKGRPNMLCIIFRYNTAYWNAKLILQGILKLIETFFQYRMCPVFGWDRVNIIPSSITPYLPSGFHIETLHLLLTQVQTSKKDVPR